MSIEAPPCIVCGCELQGCAMPNQPLNGLAFHSSGAYGTTAFDPMDGSTLEVNVCDRCLKVAGAGGRVLLYPASRRTNHDTEATPWGATGDIDG